MPRLSPKELYDDYRKGFSGCIWEQHHFDHLMETLKYPLLEMLAKKLKIVVRVNYQHHIRVF